MSADTIIAAVLVGGSVLVLAGCILYVAWKFNRDLDAAWSNPYLDASAELIDERIEAALLAGPLDESAETFDAALLPLSDSPAARRIRAMLDEQAALVELRAEIAEWEAS